MADTLTMVRLTKERRDQLKAIARANRRSLVATVDIALAAFVQREQAKLDRKRQREQ